LRIISCLPGLYSLLAFVVARRVRVDGNSMYPELCEGDFLLFDRLAYVRDEPRAGDIVLARHPSRDMRIVKRLVATPGQAVRGITLEGGQYWLEGDNAESSDSRDFGPVTRRDLLARAWLVYWPAARLRAIR
jgi:signal peptidase I